MAGGLTYTALDSTSLSTAEIYGQALVELGEAHPVEHSWQRYENSNLE